MSPAVHVYVLNLETRRDAAERVRHRSQPLLPFGTIRVALEEKDV